MMKQRNKRWMRRITAVLLFLSALTLWMTAFAVLPSAAGETPYIYFDLAAGNVTINATTYSGYVWRTVNGTSVAEAVSGTHSSTNRYYVYQSTAANRATTGLIGEGTTAVVLPTYTRLSYDGKAWGTYITNNTDTTAVANNWTTAATAAGRTGTANYVTVSGNGTYDVTIDNLWSTKNDSSTSRKTGGIACTPSKGASATFRLVGDTRFGNLHYNYASDDGTHMVFENGDSSSAPGSLTVVSYDGKANHYNSVIGGNDSGAGVACGMWFNGGIIYAGGRTKATYAHYQTDNCSAIGGGGNDKAVVVINGGKVTAVSSTTGTAIGGGIGFSQTGGVGVVNINGGEVYAYNLGYLVDKYPVPASAIGGAGSNARDGSQGTVNITGGKVYAMSVGGAAIGGGSSVAQKGGNAIVNISGTADVTALSVGGIVNGVEATPGVAIGGGTAGPSGKSAAHIGGNATIKISGGTLRTGSIGGGDCLNAYGKIGNADVTISGGTLQGQVIMAGGATTPCKFTMTGGILDNAGKTDLFTFLKEEGGAVYMDDTQGVCLIEGGTIRNTTGTEGGAIYMTAGTFTLAGNGVIKNCTTDGRGGAVYLGGGTANVNGGEISDCSANAGGAIYVSNGDFFMTGGSLIKNSSTTDGGALYVSNGDVTIHGGIISNNTADNGSGGGMMVSSDGSTTITVESGEISGNHANVDGGAIAVIGGANGTVTVTVGLDELHFEDGVFVGCDHSGDGIKDVLCPVMENNTTMEEGGAIFVKGEDNTNTVLQIFCIIESGNRGGGNAAGSSDTTRSDFMKVEGGTVAVISSADNEDASLAGTGYNMIGDSMHITGGILDISGSMVNPTITAPITVDVTKSGGGYNDSRVNNETGMKYFKVNYYENFKNGDTVTGQYTAYTIAQGDQYVVRPVMYDHLGYSIRGWNYLQEPTEETPGKIYPVGSIIDFSEENLANIEGLDIVNAKFVLYASWDFNSYYVEFNPNVPEGITYSGVMGTATFSCTSAETLPENTFRYENHFFLGWSLDKSTVYLLDGASFDPLTANNGETVKLYALWYDCPHEDLVWNGTPYEITPECVITGNTLTENCVCGVSRSFSLTVENSVYDGTANEAILSSSSGVWEWGPLTMVYTPTSAPLVGGLPVNADSYTVSVTANGNVLSVPFVIEKAQQAAPEKPTFTVEGANLTVDAMPNSLQSGAPVKYGLSHYTSGGEPATDWQDTLVFAFETTWTTYYVSVYYPETENYLASDIVSSDTQYVYRTAELDVMITITKGEGINCIASDYTVDGNVVGVKITVTLIEGYYYPADFGATASEGAIFGKLSEDPLVYTITDISSDVETISVVFSDACKMASVAIYVSEGEVFKTLNGTLNTLTVAQDSAFTLRFEILDYSSYTALRLIFDRALPEGTALILKRMSDQTYWYYKVGSGGTDQIAITAWTRMGGTESLDVVGSELIYQLVIDFSQVDMSVASNRLAALNATVAADGTDPNTPELPAQSAQITFRSVNFSVSDTGNGTGLEAELDVVFAQTVGDFSATKWESRVPVLVLTPDVSTQILGDMTLTVLETVGTEFRTTSYTVNADGRFIVPLARDVDTVLLNLHSEFFPTGISQYTFLVAMYGSVCGNAPMDDEILADGGFVTFTAQVSDSSPAIRIFTDKVLYAPDGTVSVTLQAQNVKNYSYEILLKRKNENGDYSETAYSVDGTCEDSSLNLTTDLNLQGFYDDGAYSFTVVLRDSDNAVVTEVSCYFIIYH